MWIILGILVSVIVGYAVYKITWVPQSYYDRHPTFRIANLDPIEIYEGGGKRVEVYDVRELTSREVSKFFAAKQLMHKGQANANHNVNEDTLRITYE